MHKARLDINATPFDDRKKFLRTFNRTVEGIVRDARNDTAAEVLASLQEQPGPVKRPIEWTSDKQRKAFFATNGFGGGIPYQRTGRLAASWTYEAKGTTVEIANEGKGAVYVYGRANLSGGFSSTGGFAPQQKFHRNTGWFGSLARATKAFEMFKKAFNDKYAGSLELLGSVKFTRR